MLIPNFKTEYFNLLPVIWLVIIGLLIEKHYVSRLTFFSNSVALISYFGIKDSLPSLGGLIIVVYFVLSCWSFLSYVTNNEIPRIQRYENFVEENPWLLKIGSSLITGLVILADILHVI